MRKTIGALLALAFVAAMAGDAAAQSTPSDLTGLSLAELMKVDMVHRDSQHATRGRWSIGYDYQRAEFEGYRKNGHRLSDETVLFRPGTEARTDENFPVIPTSIIQEVHTGRLSFSATDRVRFNVMVPFVRQETDHVSIVPGYPDFIIDSEGIGDVTVTTTLSLWRNEHHSVQWTAGTSFPTGDIEAVGDTPRAPGNQQLPYTMQLGSGTYDIPVSLSYGGHSESVGPLGSLSFGTQLLGRFRTGRNDRGYRLGHRGGASAWLKVRPLSWLEPMVKVTAQYWDHIHGIDHDLTVPGPFRFPAPVTDPDLFGGTKVNLAAGARVSWPEGLAAGSILEQVFGGQAVDVEFGRHIHQNLNGPQPEEDWRLGVSWVWHL